MRTARGQLSGSAVGRTERRFPPPSVFSGPGNKFGDGLFPQVVGGGQRAELSELAQLERPGTAAASPDSASARHAANRRQSAAGHAARHGDPVPDATGPALQGGHPAGCAGRERIPGRGADPAQHQRRGGRANARVQAAAASATATSATVEQRQLLPAVQPGARRHRGLSGSRGRAAGQPPAGARPEQPDGGGRGAAAQHGQSPSIFLLRLSAGRAWQLCSHGERPGHQC